MPIVSQRTRPTWIVCFGGLCLTFLVGSWLFQTLMFIAPPLVTDWSIRETALPAKGYRLEDASCRSVEFVMQLCSMSIEQPSSGELRVRPVIYAYFAIYSRQVSYKLFADPQHPGWVTTDLGLNHLVNRTITFVIALTLLAPTFAAGILGTILIVRNRRRYS